MQLINTIRYIWKLAPIGFRHFVITRLFHYISPTAEDGLDFPKTNDVCVASFFSTSTGFGTAGALLVNALREFGWKVYELDISSYFFTGRYDSTKSKELVPQNIPIIIHCNAPFLAYLYFRLGKKFLNHRYIIGYWAWELEEIPTSWKHGYSRVNQLVGVSSFCADAFKKHTDKKVSALHHPATDVAVSNKKRSDFGINENAFVVFFMFSMGSCMERKNPIASIKAFKEAFGHSKEACFILKVSGTDKYKKGFDLIKKEIDGYENITLITENMQYEDVMALIKLSDVILSLHRSEGFGLLISEAMLLEKAVITTKWSGNMDFTDESSVVYVDHTLIPVQDPQEIFKLKTAVWADPNITQASDSLKFLKDNPDERIKLGKRARTYVLKKIGTKAVHNELKEILC